MLPSKALDARGERPRADRANVGQRGPAARRRGERVARAPARARRRRGRARLAAGRGEREAFVAGVKASGSRVYEGGRHAQRRRADASGARRLGAAQPRSPTRGVLCVDSGAHRAWCSPSIGPSAVPATHLSSTNLGPMGGAIPLGIGAKLARPERPLMVATGDGCMLMHGMELLTAVRERLPLVRRCHEQPRLRQHLVPRARARPRTRAADRDRRHRLGRLRAVDRRARRDRRAAARGRAGRIDARCRASSRTCSSCASTSATRRRSRPGANAGGVGRS